MLQRACLCLDVLFVMAHSLCRSDWYDGRCRENEDPGVVSKIDQYLDELDERCSTGSSDFMAHLRILANFARFNAGRLFAKPPPIEGRATISDVSRRIARWGITPPAVVGTLGGLAVGAGRRDRRELLQLRRAPDV